MGLVLSDICLEGCLSNFKNFNSHRAFVNELFNKETFDEQIKSYESGTKMSNQSGLPSIPSIPSIPDIPGLSKWVETDPSGEKYISYKFGNSNNDTKSFKYEHMEQLKEILLGFIDYVENLEKNNDNV